jgi:hypothetical protein
LDTQELTKAETARASILLTEIAKKSFAILKSEIYTNYHYAKIYDCIDRVISQIITIECNKILSAVKIKPAQFYAEAKAEEARKHAEAKAKEARKHAEAKAKEARKKARAILASELHTAKSTLRRLKKEIQNAEVIAAKTVEEHAKQKRKLQAQRLLSSRARLKALREAEIIASSAWASNLRKIVEEDSSNYYPSPPPGLFSPNKDGLGFPAHSGIYFIWSGNIVEYVGQSVNLASRLRLGNHHVIKPEHKISFLLFPKRDLTWAENYYIGALRCPLNYGIASSHARADAALRT